MAKIGLPKGSGKRLKVWEKSVKSQGILKWILSGNPACIALGSHSTSLHHVVYHQLLHCITCMARPGLSNSTMRHVSHLLHSKQGIAVMFSERV